MSTSSNREQEFLNAVLENAGALVVVLDHAGRIRRFNKACEKLSGYTLAEVEGKFPWDTVLPAASAETIRREAFETLAHNPQSLAAKYTNDWVSKSGTRYRIEWSNTVLRDTAGKMEFMVSVGVDVTERHRTEQQLLLKNAAMEHALNGIALGGLDGRLTYVNPAFLSMWGYQSADEVLGRMATEFWVQPEQAAVVIGAMQQQGRWNGALDARHADGGTFTAEMMAVMIRDAAGQPLQLLGSFVDVTTRQQNERELQHQRMHLEDALKRLNEAQRLAKVGSWELDLTTNTLNWSDEIFRMFEIDSTRFGATYEAFLHAIHPDDRDAVNKAYTGSLSDRKPYEIIHRLQMADGRIKWVHERCESTFDDAGRPLRSVGTVQDVTALHETEQELRRHREHLEEIVRERTEKLERMRRDTAQTSQMLRTVLDTAPFRIFWKDLDCRFLGCNDLFAADAGKKNPLELVGKTDFDMAWKATAELYRADDKAVMASGAPKLNFEEPMDFPDGSRIWLSTSKVPLRDTSGHVVGVLGAYEIITARKLAEAELIQAKENAERANKAKSEFLARMSHELRTPMNAILGFAQILEMEPIGADAVSFANEIHRAGDHLLELINELLDLSRIEAGKLITVLEPVNLQQSVADAVQITQALMTAKHIALHNNCDPHVTVLADSTRLKQILVNLLSNAAKYNRTDGQVVVACGATTDERLRITVTDTGPGIAPEKLALLFKPFERLGAEFSSVDGTGIGLALSKQLAVLMGGALGVESTPGQGSTFWLDLPKAQPAPETKLAATSSQNQNAGQRTVLYVEDNATNLRLVEAIFRRHPQLRLLSATHGEQGLELARRYTPDVILLDIHLPDMDGYALFDTLRKDPATCAIPVVALSADAMPIDIEKGLAAGFKQYVTKPIRVELLLAALEEVLAASNSRC